jgi:hypothetical protein
MSIPLALGEKNSSEIGQNGALLDTAKPNYDNPCRPNAQNNRTVLTGFYGNFQA